MIELIKHLNKTSTASILAIMWTLLAGIIFILVLVGNITLEAAMISIILQSVISVINYIIGFYHGNSKNSTKEKDKE